MTGWEPDTHSPRPPVTTPGQGAGSRLSAATTIKPKDGFPPSRAWWGARWWRHLVSQKWPLPAPVSQPCSPGSGLSVGPDILASPSIRRQTTSTPRAARGKGWLWPTLAGLGLLQRRTLEPRAPQLPLLPGDAHLEPMPEDCRECRRFLAVASGWASASLLDGCLQGPT